MILHTINKASALVLCEHLIEADDYVVLMEEGVYLMSQPLPGRIHAISTDVIARGLTELVGHTPQIDYDALVELSVTADKVCNWF